MICSQRVLIFIEVNLVSNGGEENVDLKYFLADWCFPSSKSISIRLYRD